MSDKPIFYDSDVLVCFLEINETEILKQLFSKIIIPGKVFDELNCEKTPIQIKTILKKLIKENFVEINEIEIGSQEYIDYTCMINGYWSNGKKIGYGESATIALAINNNGIVASNNLRDIVELCEKYELPILTAPLILTLSLKLNVKTRKEINNIWDKIIKNTNQKLPKNTFDEYYDELFEKDYKELLKNYNIEKQHKLLKKEKIKINTEI